MKFSAKRKSVALAVGSIIEVEITEAELMYGAQSQYFRLVCTPIVDGNKAAMNIYHNVSLADNAAPFYDMLMDAVKIPDNAEYEIDDLVGRRMNAQLGQKEYQGKRYWQFDNLFPIANENPLTEESDFYQSTDEPPVNLESTTPDPDAPPKNKAKGTSKKTKTATAAPKAVSADQVW